MVLTNDDPGRYEFLLQYYDHYQYRQDESQSLPVFHFPNSNDQSVNYNLKHNLAKAPLKQEFGVDTFAEFVHTFGPDVFILWKAALLRKRIMFIHVPPMEIACKYGNNMKK